MIWIVLVLSIAFAIACSVACWYRGKWHDYKRSSVSKFDYDILCHKEEMLRDELEQTCDICELLSKLNVEFLDDKLKMFDENVKLLGAVEKVLGEVEQLRSQLPKRDSKGRFCKK